MRYLHIINEATNTADIDRLARKYLEEELSRTAKIMWGEFFEEYSVKNPMVERPNDHGYPEGRYNSEAYDAFHQTFKRNNFASIFAMAAQRAFARAGREMVAKKFGHKFSLFKNETTGEDIMFHSRQIDIRVKIEELTDDRLAGTAGGYFQQGAAYSPPQLVVFVKKDTITEAGLAAIQLEIFSEAEELHNMSRKITPVFVHEYAHLIQWLSGGYKAVPGRDKGYTSLGSDEPYSRRRPSESRMSYLRYLGSAKEIDSFASEAASELMAGNSDEDIKNILGDLALGYGSESTNRYHDIYYSALEDEFAEENLNKKEMKYVWKRFLKLVYLKIKNYHTMKYGKSNYLVDTPPEWVEWAGKGIRHAAEKLAIMVAMDEYENAPYNTPNIALGYSEVLNKASLFLERYFFGDDINFEHSMKITEQLKKVALKYYTYLYDRDRMAA